MARIMSSMPIMHRHLFPDVLLSSLLAVNALVLIERKAVDPGFILFDRAAWHYLVFLFIGILLASRARSRMSASSRSFGTSVTEFLLILIPVELVLYHGLFLTDREILLHPVFHFFAGAYPFLLAFVLLRRPTQKNVTSPTRIHTRISRWLSRQGICFLTVLGLLVALGGFLLLRDIGNFAGVDEPLWTFDRIPSYWKNIYEGDWAGTNISDKPGVTIALISGAGLPFIDDPKSYEAGKDNSQPKDILPMNRAFRIPIALFAALSIPLFYVLCERLLGRRAGLLSAILVGLSPILIGISRLVNPDALLWIFVPSSLLAFLVFRKRREPVFLHLSGIIFGLALLTKYVANILFPFLLLLIPLSYLLKARANRSPEGVYLREAIRDVLGFTVTAVFTFFLLYPTTWMRPDELLKGTMFSEAFAPVWPLFVVAAGFLAIDGFVLDGKMLHIISRPFRDGQPIRHVIGGLFLIITLLVIGNTLAGMPFADFQSILSAPKSSYRGTDIFSFFLTNFYPLLFGIPVLALSGLILGSILLFRSPDNRYPERPLNVIAILLFFVLIYEVAATTTHVASMARYQIILFPIVSIISGTAFSLSISPFLKTLRFSGTTFIGIALLAMFSVLVPTLHSGAFPLSYASILLPKPYFLDVKDMGAGSYEAAMFLNTLPDAEHLSVWTDKKGLCTFFVGQCHTELSFEELDGVALDYVVVSWSRKSRTSSVVSRDRRLSGHPVLDFSTYYDREDSLAYRLDVGGRPGQYVKIIPVESLHPSDNK
ncbi:MAG: phospholipid carrier-dependent glycosyltransferase [Candidatus Moranbacteria bacterium]|nr:phospholipid carrier-dependent glycosyltransferase [Candidatus Moranbacteria bacterium]NTW75832.1 phospholipid carrier-dependent glycosyltransferase [Candidatus Moranbacteria bacterium]